MATHLDQLRATARHLPESPGVYFWKDPGGATLYIGKAVNLRARVTSYFSTAQRERRTRELLRAAASIEYEVTATELEALFRESALIKREQPPYNRLLRESSPGYYIKFDRTVPDPYLQVSRARGEDGSLYFGPFRSGAVLRETVEYLHAVLPLRKCRAARPRCRPCLYFQMNRCAAPILGGEYRQKHDDAIEQLFELLDGRHDRVLAWLEHKRDRLSDNLLFERAAEVQQRLDALHELIRKQVILDAAVQCRCVLIHQTATPRHAAQMLLVAHGSVLSVRDAPSEPDGALRWVRAHLAIARIASVQQPEMDAAMVLERWLRVRRDEVRWVAIPYTATDEDLRERVLYALNSAG